MQYKTITFNLTSPTTRFDKAFSISPIIIKAGTSRATATSGMATYNLTTYRDDAYEHRRIRGVGAGGVSDAFVEWLERDFQEELGNLARQQDSRYPIVYVNRDGKCKPVSNKLKEPNRMAGTIHRAEMMWALGYDLKETLISERYWVWVLTAHPENFTTIELSAYINLT